LSLVKKRASALDLLVVRVRADDADLALAADDLAVLATAADGRLDLHGVLAGIFVSRVIRLRGR
jgi:hypothetical protein